MKIVALLAVLVGAAPVLSNPVCLQNEARAAPTKTVVTRFSYMVPMGVDALTQYFTQEKAAKYYVRPRSASFEIPLLTVVRHP